jgi:hypothetical protein
MDSGEFMAENKTPLGWTVPVEVRDRFQEYCDMIGMGYGDALASAMIIWQYLPASVQRQARLEAAGKPGVDREFWEELSRGLDDAILGRVRNPDRKPDEDHKKKP